MCDPRIGQRVHYVGCVEAEDGGVPQPVCRAAIVTDVYGEPPTYSLVIFSDAGMSFYDALQDEDVRMVGTWHLPEGEPQ